MKKLIIFFSALATLSVSAREKAAGEKSNPGGEMGGKVMANCAIPKSGKEIKYNNVRTIIYTGGDMWWDLVSNARYIIPKTEDTKNAVSSSFAGSIWLGGLDAGGQLKVAAMTYRQNGIDFWPGPLDTTNASADPIECAKYDQIYEITREEVDRYVAGKTGPTANMLAWPGNGASDKNQGRQLAPFYDANGDGFYDPAAGDYPSYDVRNEALKDQYGYCKTKLYGDYTLFWVFNDKGGQHTETSALAPMGVEVRAQAFEFKTNDEINNMSFYSYEVFNRSSFQINKTYFTIWNDADLGYYLDDYVGCDVARGLGYIYNADPFDETFSGVNGYQDFPPSLGCDFFRGPIADKNDGIDNDQDKVVDEAGESIQMSRFTYYNNNYGAFPPQTTNPEISIHYYNFMTGFWKDGSAFTQGGNAYGGTSPAQYVYDGDPVTNTGWTEKNSGNLPGDRRFLQSAGPFTLKPGAVNYITFGMPWAQSPNKGGYIESVKLLKIADDKAQALFDNCFKILDGPEAPDMTIQEMNNELIVYLTNQKGVSNNFRYFNNDYAEEDITILSDPTSTIPALVKPDKYYKFEGYKVYQVRDALITSTDLGDETKAKLIFQCDLQNGIKKLINYVQDNAVGSVAPKVMVDGADGGITSTFRVTQDAFSTLENRNLINHKSYYFIAVAYAYNNYLKYAPDVSPVQDVNANYLGQKRPYLEGRKLKKAAGIPHNTDIENGGTTAQSVYGLGPKITRHEGQGNGGNLLTLTQETEDKIVASGFEEKLTYEGGKGPINIKIVDPLNVKAADYTFKLINKNFRSVWTPTAAAGTVSWTAPGSPTTDITYTTNPTQPRLWLNPMPSPASSLNVINPGNNVLTIGLSYITTSLSVHNGSNIAQGLSFVAATTSLTSGQVAPLNAYTGNGGNIAALNIDNTSWELIDNSTGKVYHPNEPSFVVGTTTNSAAYKDTLYQTIKVGNEFYFPELGFSINVKQVSDPGEELNSFTNHMSLPETYTGPKAGSFLGATEVYEGGTANWLYSIQDVDGPDPSNWILSGNSKGSGAIIYGADAYYNVTPGSEPKPSAFYDPEKQFGKINNGSWAPYPLTASYYTLTPGVGATPSRYYGGPGFDGNIWKNDFYFQTKYNLSATPSQNPGQTNTDLRKLSSVKIVYTRDKSKWTRCPVLEMQEKSMLSEGNAPFFSPRNHWSVDKNGNYDTLSSMTDPNASNFISKKGMGWFPGYAINIETGERLNMAFGEDSYQRENNGMDMRWNPTFRYSSPYAYSFGGKHFVYVFAGNTIESKFTTSPANYKWETDLDGQPYGVGRYDYAKRMMRILNDFFKNIDGEPLSGGFMTPFNAFERDIMYVSMPMLNGDAFSFTDPANMPSDVKIQINVSKPYRYGWSGVATYTSQSAINMNKFASVTTPSNLTVHTKTVGAANNNFPLYTFNTSEISTLYQQSDVSKNALDQIRVVPNPYYGSSSYETNRIDNRVKITNLPAKCVIKIYTMNGTLVRTLKRDVTGQEDLYVAGDTKQTKFSSSIDWDLKNQSNISVASGLYIFHIDAEGVGEKIVKWFGVMRPLDVQNY